MIAFLFPGQGSQSVGMGKGLAERFPEARAVFEEADAALRERLSDLIFHGPSEQLTLTENTQPAILTMSIAAYRALDARDLPGIVAGRAETFEFVDQEEDVFGNRHLTSDRSHSGPSVQPLRGARNGLLRFRLVPDDRDLIPLGEFDHLGLLEHDRLAGF